MSREVAYAMRSTDPVEAAKLVEAAEKGRSKAIKRAMKWADRRFGKDAMICTTYNQFDGTFGVTGFVLNKGLNLAGYFEEMDEDAKKGLRYDKKSRALVPAKRTDEGKELAKEIAGLGYRFPRIHGLGGIVHAYGQGPEVASHRRQGYFTGWHYDVFKDGLGGDGDVQVFATLSVPYPDERDLAHAEEGKWETVRLSTYHLARENHEQLEAEEKAAAEQAS